LPPSKPLTPPPPHPRRQGKNLHPGAAAFKGYDPEGTGFVDVETLRGIFQNLGFGDITDDDLNILIETGDVDNDGRISCDDFRKMLEFNAAPAAGAASPAGGDEGGDAEGA